MAIDLQLPQSPPEQGWTQEQLRELQRIYDALRRLNSFASGDTDELAGGGDTTLNQTIIRPLTGVQSFNGRDGEVEPQAGDYTEEMIGVKQRVYVRADFPEVQWEALLFRKGETADPLDLVPYVADGIP